MIETTRRSQLVPELLQSNFVRCAFESGREVVTLHGQRAGSGKPDVHREVGELLGDAGAEASQVTRRPTMPPTVRTNQRG